jgi:hypothetical protein
LTYYQPSYILNVNWLVLEVNDEALNLALSIHSNPGVYSLLIGSGVSRSAAIPTGLEIVDNLISKLKILSKDTTETDLKTWYKLYYKEDPDYSKILERISPTQTERNAILRSYFEPTQEEREQQLRVPTLAHKAIASLVKDGYVKVIITTNFDRLLEVALEEQGITSIVVSTDDSIAGAIPYIHSTCTIVKVNGDYRDTRIKNTRTELENYSPALNSYLDRILDEFGLIVCGWSGEWDTALKSAIIRCPSRRYTTYWSSRHAPNEESLKLIEHRQARVIHIESADKFFTNLYDNVKSLKQMEPLNPASIPVAIAMTKRFLSEEKYRITLHDLVSEEVEKCRVIMDSPRFTFPSELKKEEFQARMHDYEAVIQRLSAVLNTISFFGEQSHSCHITNSINRLAESATRGGIIVLINLLRYPALLLSYSCGIVSLAVSRWWNLAAVLNSTTIRDEKKKFPAIKYLNVWNVFDNDVYKWVPRPNAQREFTPANLYLQELLRIPLKPYIPSDAEYQGIFDIFEYLLALVYLDSCSKTSGSNWAPLGCFAWRYKHAVDDGVSTPIGEFFSRGISLGKEWGLLTTGLFGGSPERLVAARDKFELFLKEVASHWY